MKIEMSCICDAATDQGGKLNILGAFDTLVTKELPLVHSHCACAFRIRFNRVEAGEHKVRINIVNQDGKGIVPPIEGGLTVQIPENQGTQVNNLIINMQGLRFPEAGHYSLDLAIDGRHELSLPINIQWLSPIQK